MTTPNDPEYPKQYGLRKVGAPTAWDKTTGSSSITLAVIYTGIDLASPEFVGRLLPGKNTWDGGSVQDAHGRGTSMAGIAAATGNNMAGMAGLDWRCKILPVKVTNNTGSSSYASLAAGIKYAADNGAKVLLIGVTTHGALTVKAAVDYAVAKGCLLIAPAGDEGMQNLYYPAKFPDVMAVGSTDENDRWGGWDGIPRSNFGLDIKIVAPGMRVLTLLPGGRYDLYSGTRAASAMVAGAATLLWSVNPTWTAKQIVERLRATVDPINPLDAVNFPNAGRLNIARAIGAVVAPPPPPPPPPPAPPLAPIGLSLDVYNVQAIWTNKATDATGVELRYGPAGEGIWTTYNLTPVATSIILSVAEGMHYQVEVRACREDVCSEWVSASIAT